MTNQWKVRVLSWADKSTADAREPPDYHDLVKVRAGDAAHAEYLACRMVQTIIRRGVAVTTPSILGPWRSGSGRVGVK